jgi:hypothetical protein
MDATDGVDHNRLGQLHIPGHRDRGDGDETQLTMARSIGRAWALGYDVVQEDPAP